MKPRFIKLFLALFLPFASFLLLAHFLFYYNNKYENNPVYPMGGVMFCSDADLSGDSVIFLAHQWNFFPGKQYTPSDFNEKSVRESARKSVREDCFQILAYMYRFRCNKAGIFCPCIYRTVKKVKIIASNPLKKQWKQTKKNLKTR